MLTNPSCPLVINGKEYEAKALNDRDYDELVLFVRSNIVKINRQIANELNLDDDERSEQIQEGIKVAASVFYNSKQYWEVIGTVEGNLRIAWHMIQKKVPYTQFIEECKINIVESQNAIFDAHRILHPVAEKKEPPEENSKSN